MQLSCNRDITGMINLVVAMLSSHRGKPSSNPRLFYFSCCHKIGHSKATGEIEHNVVCRWRWLELGE